MMIPASVATVVAMRIGMKTSVGMAAPLAARKARIVVGMMVRPLVLSTRNMIIGLVAVSFRVFSSCICCMAFSPVGVAALSSPSIWFFGISGKSLVKTGLRTRASTLTAPARSPIFMMPSHKANTPVRPKEVSKAVLEESKVACTMLVNTSVLPMKHNSTSPKRKAMTKKAIQM